MSSARGTPANGSRTTTPGAVGLLLTTKRYRVELASTLSGGQTTLTYFVAAR